MNKSVTIYKKKKPTNLRTHAHPVSYDLDIESAQFDNELNV